MTPDKGFLLRSLAPGTNPYNRTEMSSVKRVLAYVPAIRFDCVQPERHKQRRLWTQSAPRAILILSGEEAHCDDQTESSDRSVH
jgi:hypothetical protein